MMYQEADNQSCQAARQALQMQFARITMLIAPHTPGCVEGACADGHQDNQNVMTLLSSAFDEVCALSAKGSMTQTGAPCGLLELPRDVLCSIVEQCGPREKWALFMTCHSGRRFIAEAAQQISGSLCYCQLPVQPRPPLLLRDPDGSWLSNVQLKLTCFSLSSLLRRADQLRGIKHLKLVRVHMQATEKRQL
jgi:hypothetical protein